MNPLSTTFEVKKGKSKKNIEYFELKKIMDKFSHLMSIAVNLGKWQLLGLILNVASMGKLSNRLNWKKMPIKFLSCLSFECQLI